MTFTCAAAGFFVFACTAPDIQVPAARLCEVGAILRYSRHDTPETIRQARVANAKLRAVCLDAGR